MSRAPVGAHPGRVLVVDDSRTVRASLQIDLEQKGFEVLQAASGEDCLELARAAAPECVIMDVSLPGMSGVETCRKLKEDPLTANLPVLFLTGHATDEALTVEALEAGGNDFVTKPYSASILYARVRCQITIFRAHARLQELAMTDELTGAYSRRFLFEALTGHVKQLGRSGSRVLSCLMIDVDHFKRINDEHGHLEGDRVLATVAQVLRRCVRGGDVVGRFGGEEFVVVLPQTDRAGAMVVAEKIRAAVAAEGDIPITISVGVATFVLPEGAAEQRRLDLDQATSQLLHAADQAVYRAKRQGRNRVCGD